MTRFLIWPDLQDRLVRPVDGDGFSDQLEIDRLATSPDVGACRHWGADPVGVPRLAAAKLCSLVCKTPGSQLPGR